MDLSVRKKKILKILEELYPDPRSELNFVNEFQLTICVMLSAQSTDKKVNEIAPELFREYPDFASLAKAKLSSVEHIIRQVNYYKTKAKNLIATSAKVTKEYGGTLPRTHAELISLPGVGNKTANVILSEIGAASTFPVDTHVFRVAKRLGFASGENPHKVEEELKKLFEKRHWRNMHHWLIFQGRRVCKAQFPRCAECKLAPFCPSRQDSLSKSSAR